MCRHLFTAHTYLELQQNEEALQIYFGLSGAGLQVGFPNFSDRYDHRLTLDLDLQSLFGLHFT